MSNTIDIEQSIKLNEDNIKILEFALTDDSYKSDRHKLENTLNEICAHKLMMLDYLENLSYEINKNHENQREKIKTINQLSPFEWDDEVDHNK